MSLEAAYKKFDEVHKEGLEWFRNEMVKVRTGRVTTDLVNSLFVDYYGTRTPLQGVASVSSADARTLVISPWDANAIPAIEKALAAANVGAQPAVDGKIIRLAFPSLNEEMREASVKLLHKMAEEARIRLRRGRDEALSQITKEKQSGDITEDDFYDGKKELDKRIDGANKEIAEIVEKKETEIRTI